MKNTAEKIESIQPVLEYCLVSDKSDGQWMVMSGNAVYRAKKAASCLVMPERDDVVLVSIDREGHCYILSILEKSDADTMQTNLSFEGEVNLDVKNGAFNVSAHRGIRFMTPEKLGMTSEVLEINAIKGEANIEHFTFLGRLFNGRIEKIKMIADSVDSIFRRAVQRLVSSYRYIEEHEEIQSASTRMLVEGTLTMQTKNTLHTAEGHVKIDAEQIHLG